MRQWLKNNSRRLINYDWSPAYAVLDVVGGVASGLIVLGFNPDIRELRSAFGAGDKGEGGSVRFINTARIRADRFRTAY